MTVVDASVAVKWFAQEPGSETALELVLGPALLYAPELARIEVHAAFIKLYRLGHWKLETCRDASSRWDAWLASQAIRLVDDTEILAEAREMACRWKHPLQDCLYLALAEKRKDQLVTADGKFFKKVQPHCKWITLLAGSQAH